MKRKYAILQDRNHDERQILELLKSACDSNALRILACLRAADDAHSVVDFALDLASARIDLHHQQQEPVAADTTTVGDNSLLAVTSDALLLDAIAHDVRRMRQSWKGLAPAPEAIGLPSFHTLM